jgi:hypothetical protein
MFSCFGPVKELSLVHKHHRFPCAYTCGLEVSLAVSYVPPVKATVQTLNPLDWSCIGRLSNLPSGYWLLWSIALNAGSPIGRIAVMLVWFSSLPLWK